MKAVRAPRGLLLALPSLGTSLLSVGAVLVRGGWPHNHEHLAFAFRTWIYRAHLARGDLLPIWSAEDTYGLGSPLPLFYHKLFYFLSGTVHLATGSMKASLALTIVLLLLVGCLGLHLAATRLGLSRRTAAIVAATLPLQTYTLLNWLVRGSMAEFSASMIVPWLLYSLLVLIQERRVPIALPASLAALALAHSVLAYFGGITVLIAWGLTARGTDRATFLRITGRLALAALAIAVLFSPYLVAWIALADTYDVSSLSHGVYHPSQQFRDPASYLSPVPWWWGRRWDHVPLQIPPVTSLFFVVAAFVLVRSAVGGRAATRSARKNAPRGLLFLTGLLLLFGFLQLPAAGRVYDVVPGLSMIQFPWRLLAFLQVIMLLVIARFLAVLPGGRGRLFSWIFLVLSIAGTKSLHPIRYEWFSSADLERAPVPGRSAGLIGIGEFFPRLELSGPAGSGDVAFPSHAYGDVLRAFAVRRAEIIAGDETGRIVELPRTSFEPGQLEWSLGCQRETIVALPVLWSGLERIEISGPDDGVTAVRGGRTPTDPRVRVRMPAGTHGIRIRLPHAGRAFPHLLGRGGSSS